MGIRSDVFVGMKHSVQNKINDGVGTDADKVCFLLASADDCLERDEGVAPRPSPPSTSPEKAPSNRF